MEEGRLLDSWKAIAAYLGRDVRTCQRWERELGLPVHRLDGSPKARIYAYRDELDRWLAEKLHEGSAAETGLVKFARSRGSGGRLARTGRLAAVIALPAIVAIGVILFRADRTRREVVQNPAFDQPTLAVLAFENHTGDSGLDHWRDGIACLLGATLSQSKFIRVVPDDEVYSALRKFGLTLAPRYSSEEIRKIASRCRATHVLSGGYVREGENIVVTAMLERPSTRETPVALRIEANGEKGVIPTIDDLARRVMTLMNFSAVQIAHDLPKEAGQVTTAVPQALNYYLEGMRHWNRPDEAVQARECFEKAVDVDPEFAMAFQALSSVHAAFRDIANSRRCLEKALALKARLPENERLIIEARALLDDQENDKAAEVLARLLTAYPANALGRQLLARVYARRGDLDKVIHEYAILYRLTPTAANAGDLGRYQMRKGMYQDAERVCLSFLREVEDAAPLRELLGLNYLCRRQFDRALAETEEAYRQNAHFNGHEATGEVLLCKDDLGAADKACDLETEACWYHWHVCLVRGRFAEAVDWARRNLKESQWDLNVRTNVFGALPFVLEKAGRYGEALEAMDVAEKEAVSTQSPWLLGTLSLAETSLIIKAKIQVERGSVGDAEKTAETLRETIAKTSKPEELVWFGYLTGLIDMARKNYRAAISHLRDAIRNLYCENGAYHDPHALLFDGLARAYLESGDLNSAREEYSRITLLTSGRLSHGDVYSRAYYMLGKIDERRGDRRRAVDEYRKFLELWKDADPGLPEVADAAKALAGLEASRTNAP